MDWRELFRHASRETRRLWRALLFWVIALLIFVKAMIDPWGIGSTTQRQSAAISLAIVAPWYRSFQGAEAAGDMISLMLVDDAYVKAIGSTYPLPYDDQGDLLANLIYREPVADDGSDGALILPRALMLDLVYADDRGGLATFAETLRFTATDDTRVGREDADALLAISGAALDTLEPVAGLLAVDEVIGMPGRSPERVDVTAYHRQRASVADVPASPSLLLDDSLRYALAPDGIPSPALMLTIWTCATLDEERARSLRGCGERGPVSTDAIREAARAASFARVAKRCEMLARTRRPMPDACDAAAARYAANADWAPPAFAPDPTSPLEHHAAMLRDFAAARREGMFEGAMAGAGCAAPRLLDAIPGRANRAGRIAERCRIAAARADRRRIGPTMTVLWGASPRDGGPYRTDDAALFSPVGGPPAAPHTFTVDREGKRIPDACLPYRFSQDLPSRAWEAIARALGFMGFREHDYPSLCAYHGPIQPQVLRAENPEIRRYVNSRVDDRIVIVGASVVGMTDTYAMRNVTAPGAWAHAMALDNLLALGPSYRRATYSGIGFSDGTGAQMIQVLLEFALAFLIGIVFLKARLKSCLDPRATRLAEWIGLSPGFTRTLVEGAVGIALATPAMLLLAMLALLLVPALPPIDWIGIAALGVIAWAAVDSRTALPPA